MQKSRAIYFFLAALIVVNVIQCCFTGLLNDEAYYWLFSKHLAWGYFDHPPMIALFIATGDSLLHNETGVRLLSILSSTLVVYILYRMVEDEGSKLFYLVLFSITPLLPICFFWVPDMPLLFFTACFFLVYKKYTERDSLPIALLLGVCMALMLYSKYHGVLVILFVLLSNISLLKRKSFYVASIFGALLFVPHLYWQLQNDFPTFRFQLFGRVPEVYSPLRVVEYLGGQLLLAGIPVGLLLLYAAFKRKSINKFERALHFQLWGTYLFFLLASFKGRVEANWTITSVIPLFVLSYRYLKDQPQLSVWLFRLLPVSILTILGIRLYYGTDLPEKCLGINVETQGWKDWADTLSQRAGKLPVVFLSSYQKASKYTFCTGSTAFTTTEVGQRKSQFNLWNIEEQLQNQKVYVCTNWGLKPERALSEEHIKTSVWEFDGFVVDSFLSWNKLQIEPRPKSFEAKPGQEIEIAIEILWTYGEHPAPNSRSRITYRFYGMDKKKLGDNDVGISLTDALSPDAGIVKIKISVPMAPGKYELFISATQGNYPPPINSPAVKVTVK